ncbi:hypothetical protein R69888_05014 [Paraburkholderia haematera]|uniref:Uncharacterized protein n=1 Tax=Paraburkholderia haematera TaxID=2793077 RepID=A0ABN7MBT2_9BURK|nr:hypothetical protein R69888_05014 [Paraburkholderia haematera]
MFGAGSQQSVEFAPLRGPRVAQCLVRLRTQGIALDRSGFAQPGGGISPSLGTGKIGQRRGNACLLILELARRVWPSA